MANLTPSNMNLYLGSGVVYMDFWKNGAKTGGFFDLGDVSAFKTEYTAENAVKKTSRNGSRGTYRSTPKSASAKVSLTLSEFAARNFEVAVMGKRTNLTQSSSTQTSVAIPAAAVQLGAAFYTGFYGVTSFVLKKGATALTLGTDYTFDAESGAVTFVPTGTVTNGDATITWGGTVPAITSNADTTGVGRSRIAFLQNANILVSIRFKSATDATGPRYLVYLPQVQLAPKDGIDWIKDDWSDLQLEGEIQMDLTQPAGQEYGTADEL